MRTLYVSDLDGTLLRSDERTSDDTNETINRLTEEGMIFSYATARSFVTARKVTKGMEAKIPVVVYNGTFVIDQAIEKVLIANYFDETVFGVLDDLFARGIYPIVYSYIEGMEKFSFFPELCSQGITSFLKTRKGDQRWNEVSSPADLKKGNLFYITCIGEPEQLETFYEKYRSLYHCVYQVDIYSGEQWFEIMPKAASKSNAAMQLKKLLDCDRLVVFGDGKNDLDLFEIADECYAVQNADEELKKKATGIIGANDEDGVARWLREHYQGMEKNVTKG